MGGFHEIIELCEDCGVEIVGIIDNHLRGEYYGYPVLGTDNDAERLFNDLKENALIITPDSPKIREKLVIQYRKIGYKFGTLISPKAVISKSAKIGLGTIIQTGVQVSSETIIGDFCKLNTCSVIMHDNCIGNFVTVAPHAVSLGRVLIKDYVYIGANSTILPELKINESATVGAGAVVTKNVKINAIVKGVPAK